MASQELKNYVQEVADAVKSLKDKKKSIELEVIDALYQASHLAMFTENDVKYSLALSNQAKKFLSERIYTETKGQYGLWSLENLSVNMGRPFPEIDLFYEILKQESFYNLQSFIYYMERKRKSDKRFYYPRRNTLNSVLNDLTEFENGKFHFYGLSMPPRTGKLIADYIPVLTKGGWKTHGELTTDDYVLGKDMQWVKVLAIHPKNVANKRVHFSDGTFIDCHENHEWLVYDKHHKVERIVETGIIQIQSLITKHVFAIEGVDIERVVDIEPTSGNCITVEGELYRVGETLKLTHNSTLCIFFLNWVMMKRPNSHNAMCGHSGVLSKGFFKETCNFITSEEYCFRELFEYWHPDATLVQNKSAEDCTITLDKPDRFATLTCRGIDGTWTGAVDISNDGYLYVDDLVRDREESMSMQRMENLYQTYQNTVLDRKNAESRELQVGTLWSINDPLERTRVLFEDDEDYRFRRIPALDDHDHSNFNYELNGFPDKYYINLRKRLDKAEWEAKYQQRPFVREGLLFPTEELRYFNGVIEDDARESTTVAVIDPAFGGGDSLSMPICRDYGHKERYIIDWVFDTGTQNKTVPKIVSKIIQHYITRLRIERNSGGQLLADSIKQEMARQGCIHCKIELVGAPVKMSKEDKISAYSDFVKDNFIFLLPNIHVNKGIFAYRRSVEYQRAMDEMCMFSAQGKQPHDDAPDSITQLAIMFDQKSNGSIDVVKNPFKY